MHASMALRAIVLASALALSANAVSQQVSQRSAAARSHQLIVRDDPYKHHEANAKFVSGGKHGGSGEKHGKEHGGGKGEHGDKHGGGKGKHETSVGQSKEGAHPQYIPVWSAQRGDKEDETQTIYISGAIAALHLLLVPVLAPIVRAQEGRQWSLQLWLARCLLLLVTVRSLY